MKTEIFSKAISNRNRVKLLYNLQETLLEPYFLSINRSGKKVVFGRINNSPEIKMIEYDKIFNIKILGYSQFSPIIPILN
ncbi:MAG: hypothetical protein GXO85_17455 [Chlorobi bacterium]|nr:hypothetical protein [Chlorobiota bacterium]